MDKLKVKIYRDIVMNEKEEQLETEDARKEVDREFLLNRIDEDVDESEEYLESAEELES